MSTDSDRNFNTTDDVQSAIERLQRKSNPVDTPIGDFSTDSSNPTNEPEWNEDPFEIIDINTDVNTDPGGDFPADNPTDSEPGPTRRGIDWSRFRYSLQNVPLAHVIGITITVLLLGFIGLNYDELTDTIFVALFPFLQFIGIAFIVILCLLIWLASSRRRYYDRYGYSRRNYRNRNRR